MKGLLKLGILFYGMPLKQKSQMVLGKVPFDYTRNIGTSLFYASLKIKFFPLIKALFLSKISCLGPSRSPQSFHAATRSSPIRMNKKRPTTYRKPFEHFIGFLGPFAKVGIILLIVKCFVCIKWLSAPIKVGKIIVLFMNWVLNKRGLNSHLALRNHHPFLGLSSWVPCEICLGFSFSFWL